MPVYNGAHHLKEAIESVLKQTYRDFIFLIIDDASTDRSVDLINAYSDKRIRLVQNNKNIGQTATLNKGLKLASSKYIARLDQDDMCLPTRIEEQVAFLDSVPFSQIEHQPALGPGDMADTSSDVSVRSVFDVANGALGRIRCAFLGFRTGGFRGGGGGSVAAMIICM